VERLLLFFTVTLQHVYSDASSEVYAENVSQLKNSDFVYNTVQLKFDNYIIIIKYKVQKCISKLGNRKYLFINKNMIVTVK